MSLKKMFETNLNSDSGNSDFLAVPDELKKMFNHSKNSEHNISYSTNIDKFNNDCADFMEYIKECSVSAQFCSLYMLREGNTIRYGKRNQGGITDEQSIEMISNEDLKNLYALLQNEFSEDFVENYRESFITGWSLYPSIGENIRIDVDSNIDSDKIWFCEKLPNKDEKTKKK